MGLGDPLQEEELQVPCRITLERGHFGYAIHSLYFGSHYHGNKPFLCMLRHMEDLGAHYLLNEDEYILDFFFHTYILLGSNFPL